MKKTTDSAAITSGAHRAGQRPIGGSAVVTDPKSRARDSLDPPHDRTDLVRDERRLADPSSPLPAESCRRANTACMMPDHGAAVAQELLLQDADFPRHFVEMQHPEDYLVSAIPVTQFIDHVRPHHNRLIARICWQKSDAEFIPMSFVCDTGAPMGFYLSEKARLILESIGRVEEVDRSGMPFIRIREVGVAAVDETPIGHTPANIMGLTILRRVGLHIDPSSGKFEFLAAPIAW